MLQTLPMVPPKLQGKIAHDEYVDFSEMLHAYFTTMDASSSIDT